MKNIETIKDKYTSIIYNTNNLKDLDKVRISAVGKKGEISCMMQEIGKMSIDQKKQISSFLCVFFSSRRRRYCTNNEEEEE